MNGLEKNYLWSIKTSTEVLDKLKTRAFCASSLSTFDFSTLFTSLPHKKLINLIETTFREKVLFILLVMIKLPSLPHMTKNDHLYGKLLFTWLSLVMSMMLSFCAVLFPTRCLG